MGFILKSTVAVITSWDFENEAYSTIDIILFSWSSSYRHHRHLYMLSSLNVYDDSNNSVKCLNFISALLIFHA